MKEYSWLFVHEFICLNGALFGVPLPLGLKLWSFEMKSQKASIIVLHIYLGTNNKQR